MIACLSETERLDTKVNAQVRGTQLYNGVIELAKKHTIVGDVRGGHGLMLGIELVSDQSKKHH